MFFWISSFGAQMDMKIQYFTNFLWKFLCVSFLWTLPGWSKPLLVASFPLVQDIVQNIAGSEFEVRSLVGRNEDPHVYQMNPKDLVTLKQAEMIFIHGWGIESWLEFALRSQKLESKSIQIVQGVQPLRTSSGEKDPHVWQDPQRAQTYIQNILQALVKKYPEKKSIFEKQAAMYLGQLDDIAKNAKKKFDALPIEKKKIVTTHDAFRYFAEYYQVQMSAPQGWSSEGQASAKDLIRIIHQIRKENIRALFLEDQMNPKILEKISQETGVRIGGILYSDTLSKNSDADTYLRLLSWNAEKIYQTLR
jgi:zinc/manganese transport system substrate-binding protein